MTFDEAALIVRLVAARYPKQVTGNAREVATAWHMSLADVPYQAAETVLADFFRNSRWMPDPSEIRSAVLAEIAAVPTPDDAWAMVLEHMRNNGMVGGRPFDGPEVVMQAVASVGGWYRLRRSEDPERDRDAFARAYATYAKRAIGRSNIVELMANRTAELPAASNS